MKLIILNGPPGVGKSTISARLHADTADSVLIDVDELRRSIPNYKEQRRESLLLSYEKTKEAIAHNLKEGKTVIIDKGISFPDTLDSFVATGKEQGADIVEIILFAPKNVVQGRADERGYRPGSLLTRERVGELWDQLNELRESRPQAIVIDTEGMSVEETYERVKALAS